MSVPRRPSFTVAPARRRPCAPRAGAAVAAVDRRAQLRPRKWRLRPRSAFAAEGSHATSRSSRSQRARKGSPSAVRRAPPPGGEHERPEAQLVDAVDDLGTHVAEERAVVEAGEARAAVCGATAPESSVGASLSPSMYAPTLSVATEKSWSAFDLSPAELATCFASKSARSSSADASSVGSWLRPSPRRARASVCARAAAAPWRRRSPPRARARSAASCFACRRRIVGETAAAGRGRRSFFLPATRHGGFSDHVLSARGERGRGLGDAEEAKVASASFITAEGPAGWGAWRTPGAGFGRGSAELSKSGPEAEIWSLLMQATPAQTAPSRGSRTSGVAHASEESAPPAC